jgi:hypothetical protein
MAQAALHVARGVNSSTGKVAAVLLATLVVIGFVINVRSPADLLFFFLLALLYALAMCLCSLIFVRLTHRITADPSTEPFDPCSPELPSAVTDPIALHTSVLESLGFTGAAHLRKRRPTQVNADLYLTLFTNQNSGQGAWILTVVPKSLFSSRLLTTLTFVTEFNDETMLTTSNGSTQVLTQATRRRGSMGLPKIQDTRLLYRLHQLTLDYLHSGASRRDLAKNDPFDYQQEVTLREFSRYLEAGDYFLDRTEKWYRPTWKGAAVVSSRLLFPLAPILKIISHRQQVGWLRELGLLSLLHDLSADHIAAGSCS